MITSPGCPEGDRGGIDSRNDENFSLGLYLGSPMTR